MLSIVISSDRVTVRCVHKEADTKVHTHAIQDSERRNRNLFSICDYSEPIDVSSLPASRRLLFAAAIIIIITKTLS